MLRRSAVAIAVFSVVLSASRAGAQGGRGIGGMMSMAHDSATMAQMRAIHELVFNHDRITRTVVNLTDGIRTVTESSDPRLARLVREHVVTMDQRAGNEAALPMASPALRAILAGKNRIRTSIDSTATGVVVVQTSSDSALVVALQKHAAEVTDLVKRGTAAMHEAMMRGRGATRGASKSAPPSR